MIRFAFIVLALTATCGSAAAWSFAVETLSEEVLADRTPRPWRYSDLQSAVSQSMRGRSFVNGRQVFQAVKCDVCHRMDDAGNEFGPNLAPLDGHWTPAKILRHTLEPSYEVNQEYRTHVFELESGIVVSGVITAVGLDSVKVVENPLAKGQPRTIQTATIQQRRTSRQSIMPTGLLDKLTRAEILDLVAYVYAGGNDRHAVFHNDVTSQ